MKIKFRKETKSFIIYDGKKEIGELQARDLLIPLYASLDSIKEEIERDMVTEDKISMTPNLLEAIKRLMYIFNESFINSNFELILERERNIFTVLSNLKTERDLVINMLERKTRPCIIGITDDDSDAEKFRDNFNEFMSEYTHKNFTEEEISLIYKKLGNGVNRELCEEFIESGYDMQVLEE